MSVSMKPHLEEKLRSRAQEEGISLDEYVDRLLREEEAAIAQTEFLLQEAAESGEHIELTDPEWSKIDQEALTQATARSKTRQ